LASASGFSRSEVNPPLRRRQSLGRGRKRYFENRAAGGVKFKMDLALRPPGDQLFKMALCGGVVAGVKGRSGSGGARPGAGRKPGPSLRTLKFREELARQNRIAEELGATGWRPSAFLMAVAADPEVPMGYRIMAAKAALPYVETKVDQLSPDQVPQLSPHQVPMLLEILQRDLTKLSDQALAMILQHYSDQRAATTLTDVTPASDEVAVAANSNGVELPAEGSRVLDPAVTCRKAQPADEEK